MRALLAVVFLAGVLAGCVADPVYMIVTVDDPHATVNGATDLRITLDNDGPGRSDPRSLGMRMFPVQFSVEVTGRTGNLEIIVEAHDAMAGLVGIGSTTTPITAVTASVHLEGADFLVNTTVAGNQYLSNDFEAVGLQLAPITGGNWTAAFRDDCTTCDVFGRRFDQHGLPVASTLSSSNMEFKITTTATQSSATPAAAAQSTNTIVVWDYNDLAMNRGIACRAIDSQGAGPANQVTIAANETSSDVVAASALSNGNFVVTWKASLPGQVIRSKIVTKDCGEVIAPATISPVSSAAGLAASRSHVAANGNSVLYVWIVDGEVWVRHGTNTGPDVAQETKLVAKTTSLAVDFVRVAPWGTGFAVAARWGSIGSIQGPGKIEVQRTTTAGVAMGKPITISEYSESSIESTVSFGIARRSDDALIVVWHTCQTVASGCDVLGRILRPTGAAVGNEFVIPTTTGGNQINPSVIPLTQEAFVVAWNDTSGTPPDDDSGVRARILYPVYNDARGVLGATCGAAAPGNPDCDPGLACGMGSDGLQRCYATCTGGMCTNGGTCDMATSACTF